MVLCINEDGRPPYYILVYLTLPFPSLKGWFGVVFQFLLGTGNQFYILLVFINQYSP